METEAVKAKTDIFSSSLMFDDALMMAANLPDSYRQQQDKVYAGNGDNTIKTGSGADSVNVGSGNNNISVFAGSDYILAGSGNNQINTGEGDDVVDILPGKMEVRKAFDAATPTNFKLKPGGSTGTNVIDLGSGSDRVFSGSGKDNILGGEGNDVINAGGGDNVVDAGSGEDTVYTLGGNDLIRGGSGKDFISSGDGDDKVYGGDSDDVISGGTGRDLLHGESGKNTIVEKDSLTAGGEITGAATIFDGSGLSPTAGEKIKISGPPVFAEQIKADIETLRQVPGANKLLQALDASGKNIEVVFDLGEDAAAAKNYDDVYVMENGEPGKGSDSRVYYNPQCQLDGGERTYKPVTILYHELVHAYNHATGTMLPGIVNLPDGNTANKCEHQAVGLSTLDTPFIKHPDGREFQGNPPEFTENYILEQFGLPLRVSYVHLFADN